jgi:hypothetical protein
MKILDPNVIECLSDPFKSLFPSNLKVVRVGVLGEGSCFFLSVCAALNKQNFLSKDEGTQRKIGNEFRCNYFDTTIQKHWQKYGYNSQNDAKQKFCNPSTWADASTFKLVADQLHHRIIVINTDAVTSGEGFPLHCECFGNDTLPLLVILWVNQCHFEPVGVVVASKAAHVGVQFKFDPVKDAKLVGHLLESFERICQTTCRE